MVRRSMLLVCFVSCLCVSDIRAEEDDEYPLAQAIAQILMGTAQVIAAISPMVVAGIQAGADTTIAGINAGAQITMTKMSADTSKALAQNQKDIAMQQARVAQAMNRENNHSTTQRLNMQLVELRDARLENLQLTKERRALEKSYNDERIELAKKQADDNLKLAKATLSAQLTQAGARLNSMEKTRPHRGIFLNLNAFPITESLVMTPILD